LKSVVVGTAGHIDHGKSALVRALTGIDPDRLKEEKDRGITIDLGFAHVVVGDVNIAFVDVPGHERFVKNMLAGAGGIDLVVLVVAADESVMPQTREHFDICRLLRVPAGVVALTKADLVDADTLELVRLEVRELVAGSFLDGAPMIAVSSKTGGGLDDLRAALVAAAAHVRGRSSEGAARLPIDRVFSMKGFGTVVTGTLAAGRIGAEDDLVIAPADGTRNRPVKVRGVQVHGARREQAVAGERSAINLGGIEVHEISRGQSLIAAGAFEQTRLADAVLELLPDARPLKHGTRVRVHQGTAEILGRIAVVGPAAGVTPGATAFVRLRLERPAILTRGDRFIVRAYSPPITIGGGRVLDPRAPRTAVRAAAALERCRRLDADSASDPRDGVVRAAAVMIEGAGETGFPVSSLVSRAGVAPPAVRHIVDALVAAGAAVVAGDTLFAPPVVTQLAAAIVDALRKHHSAEPLSEGMPREEVRERLFGRGHPAAFERAVENLTAAGTIGGRDRLALATHRVALSPDEDRARLAIERAFRDAGLKPPDTAALPAQAGVAPAVADRVLKLLQRQKVLIKIDALLFHDAALKDLKANVAALKAAAGGQARIDVGTFKERFGVTRKFAIPLLEYLDRERVTRRVGDERVVL
jgi:selenocysteine-specific elongation factor